MTDPDKRKETIMNESYGTRTLTAFFDNRADAQDAASRLKTLGIADSSIRIVGDESRTATTTYERSDEDKGFWESLGDLFLPDDDRATYAEGLRRGGTLLTVSNIPEGHYDATLDILDDEGSVDLDTRSEDWRSEGWSAESYGTASTGVADTTGFAAGSTGTAATSTNSLDATRSESLGIGRDEDVIPVMEEQLRVGKRDVNLGRVRVRSYMVEEPVNEAVNLREERVVLERRPVDRAVSGAETFTDRVIEAEEHAEEAVVSKEARVKEEISLRRESEERTETVSDTVRHTEVEVEDERTTLETDRLAGNKPIDR
jgi:uncharacterized protein (TIGR02271 family)